MTASKSRVPKIFHNPSHLSLTKYNPYLIQPSPSFAIVFQILQDESYHFKLLRNLSAARYHGADVGEILEIAGKFEVGKLESWYTVFLHLAQRVKSLVVVIDSAGHPISARDTWFRVSVRTEHGFDVLGIVFPGVGHPAAPKWTIIAGTGYDGCKEEMLHHVGFAGMGWGWGWNVIAYEGPGLLRLRLLQLP